MANQECYKLKLGGRLFVNVHDEIEYVNKSDENDSEEVKEKEIEIE